MLGLIDDRALDPAQPEYQWVDDLVASCGGGDITKVPKHTHALFHQSPNADPQSNPARQMSTALAGVARYGHGLQAVSNFFAADAGVNLEQQAGRRGDFSTGQLIGLTACCLLIGLMLTFLNVAPVQFTSAHLAAVLSSDDLRRFLVDGMLFGGLTIVVLTPLAMYSLKVSLVLNAVIACVGSLLLWLGLIVDDTPSMPLLMLGRVLVIMGGEGAFVVLLVQLNLIFAEGFVWAAAVGFIAGFGVIAQLMVRLTDAIVDAGGVEALGGFFFAASVVTVIASVVLSVLVWRADAASRARRSS